MADRPSDLELSPEAACQHFCVGLLRAVNRGFGFSRSPVHGHTRRAPRRTRPEDGDVIWDVAVGDPKNANAITAAPLVLKNKVIVGVAGGTLEPGLHRCLRRANRRARVALQHNSVAWRAGSESWPNAEVAARGGGAAWVTGSYDPALNLVYYGTGNPNPDYSATIAAADNLYTCSLVALDADTGKLRWHYQFTRTTSTIGTLLMCRCRRT